MQLQRILDRVNTAGAATRKPARKAVVLRVAEVQEPTVSVADEKKTGWDYLPEAARARALDPKANKWEKIKAKKDGSAAWTEVHELAALLREGKTEWKDLDLDDVDQRLKFVGLFHRGKRTPQKFMLRLKVPNGELTSDQLRYLAAAIRPYGAEGCADITTRANIQLRGMPLPDASDIIKGLGSVGLSSVQSGLDSVRNLTGNPIAGVDPHEIIDTRPLLREMQDVLTDNGRGSVEFTNLPRKFNICISSTRDDFPHTQINDLGFEAVRCPDSGNVMFNVVVGGLFSVKRNMMSLPMGCAVTEQQLIPFTLAMLRVFRDFGPRGDRGKTRLIYCIEELGGVEPFKAKVEEYMGLPAGGLAPAVHVQHEGVWERRDVLGIHKQKQPGMYWVGASVPAGRLTADDFEAFADVADRYGDGTCRLTCEENVLFTNIPEAKLADIQTEPVFQRFKIHPGNLERGLVSCTGSQFCGFALIETKQRAMQLVASLEAQLDLPRPVRIHWTGCPNSCGQAQVADIGLMGAPAKLDGKAVEGVRVFVGGKIGEHPELAEESLKGIPADEQHLAPVLKKILIEQFGAKEHAMA